MKLSLLLCGTAIFLFLNNGCCCVNPFAGALNEARQAAERTVGKNNLKELALAYHAHHDANNVGPANWDELIAAADQMSPDNALRELRAQGLVVAFGYSFKDIDIGLTNFVAAYFPQATSSGGDVVMMDGSVRTVSADELNQMLSDQSSIQPSGNAGT